MRKSLPLTILSLVLLQGCASAPTVLVKAVCPVLPPLQEIPSDALERSYIGVMESFLQGSLETPINYELTSKPATPSMTQPAHR